MSNMDTAPLSTEKPRVRLSMAELFQSDPMKLQVAGFAMTVLGFVVTAAYGDRWLRSLPYVPVNVMLGANCFRDRYVGPMPKLDNQDRKTPTTREEALVRIKSIKMTRQEIEEYLGRYHRYQLIWGGVYASGGSLVLVHAIFVYLRLSSWVEGLALIASLGFWAWVIRQMFQRESERRLKSQEDFQTV